MNLGKWLVLFGLLFLSVGIVLLIGAKVGLTLGKLPGDIRIERGKTSFYFPIVTCLIISLLLTLIINCFLYFFHKK
jgi:hypothetical protein